MRELLRFVRNSTRGHRFGQWRSPYLRWRMETYSGLKMDKIGFLKSGLYVLWRQEARAARGGDKCRLELGFEWRGGGGHDG